MASKVEQPDLEDDDDAEDTKGKLKPGANIESFKLASFWKGQVDQVDKANSRWHTRGNIVLKRYRDERNKLNEEGQRKMNLLWANVKVMKPAIYSRQPIPIVDRKFLDRDPTSRLSSMILERGLINEQENNFHSSVTAAVYDRLLPGRGIVWVRYEPKIGESDSIPSENPTGLEDQLAKIGEETGDGRLEDQEDEQLEETGSSVIEEKVVFDHLNWTDYYEFPAKARTFAEVQAQGKRVLVSRKEAIERFGKKIGKAMQPDTTILADTAQKSTGYSDTAVFRDINERNIVVLEIWNKSDKRVYWVSPGYEYLCDVKDDPLGLNGFFPARTLDATLTNDSRVPVPDYWEWQDQAIQIDELTSRIASLTKACKVAGVYNAAIPAINRIFNESVENKLVPVDQWAMFAEKGGLKGVIDFIPIDQVQKCLETLQTVRQACMQDLDQITGLSDIIRGTSDSRETLGGIRLKNNNAGTRLSDSQEDVARFCRELIRIAAEIMCKHFSDETLIESSGILYEEELQPDVVLNEFFNSSQSLVQTLLQGAAQPQGSPQGQPITAQHQQVSGPQGPGQSQPHPPLALPAPQNAPGGNVVPFKPPGAPGQASPPMGGQGGQQPPTQQQPTPLIPQGPAPPPPPDPEILIMQKVNKALELLKKDVQRGYRIDIEVDSTIFGDKESEKQSAIEFITAIGTVMQSAQEIGTTLPEAAPLLARSIQWVVRKSRTGRDLESEVDSFAIAMIKKAKAAAAAGPQPDPEQQKHKMELEKTQMEIKGQQENDQRDAQRQNMEFTHKSNLENQKLQHETSKMQMEMALEKDRHQMEREKMRMEMEVLKAKHQMEMQKMHMDGQLKQQDMHMKTQEHGMEQQRLGQEQQLAHEEIGMKHQEHQQTMQQQHQQHQQTMQQGHQEAQLAEKSHALEQKSMANKAKHEEKSHGLKMKTMQQQAKHKAKAVK